ncbi:COMM domain-containing protein 10, partial [Stegodyphus mimosarum]
MAMQMFVKSARIQQAVVLINKLDNSKFPLLLTRILQKLHLKEEIFTKEESAKLEISLVVDQEGLKLILQTLTFIFQQAAYHIAKPAILTQQLEQLEISEEKVLAIVQAWTSHARSVTEKLKKRTISQKQLTDTNWELRLQLAQSTMTKMKNPIGLIELTLDSDNGSENLPMEFSHADLYSFYDQLEIIQS